MGIAIEWDKMLGVIRVRQRQGEVYAVQIAIGWNKKLGVIRVNQRQGEVFAVQRLRLTNLVSNLLVATFFPLVITNMGQWISCKQAAEHWYCQGITNWWQLSFNIRLFITKKKNIIIRYQHKLWVQLKFLLVLMGDLTLLSVHA